MKLPIILALGSLLIAWVFAIYSRASGKPKTVRTCYQCDEPIDELQQSAFCDRCRKGISR